jgi:reactive intermediate/imine deaminase
LGYSRRNTSATPRELDDKHGVYLTMTGAKFHILGGFPRSVSPSSHAAEADSFVFLTGQFGRDLDDPDKPLPDGIRAQTDRTMKNLVRVLAALDLSLVNVLSVRVFLTHFKRDYEAMNEVYAGFFPANARPARTCVGVTDLVRDALVEIDCIAKR